jgi:hypothetical protein
MDQKSQRLYHQVELKDCAESNRRRSFPRWDSGAFDPRSGETNQVDHPEGWTLDGTIMTREERYVIDITF